MPVEIRELVIKAYIEGTGEEGAGAANPMDKEEIISDCMEQISELLKEKLER
ncbi:DUF5908 family protein [Thalassomonas haliotis]|uniref:Uncharacterized protein n=1 Tax=Thalassomonas haliotis TaxID=485448 RepID=A0ABY7V772_9GAMM|nr:DUF5908 family protein [Thalassomonas haliotis]WDE09527.1 hypothetical protein H3N35_14390 [Thalassomonas haliotis]